MNDRIAAFFFLLDFLYSNQNVLKCCTAFPSLLSNCCLLSVFISPLAHADAPSDPKGCAYVFLFVSFSLLGSFILFLTEL